MYLKLRLVIIFRLVLIENQDDIHFGDFTLLVFVLFQPVKMAKFIVWVDGWVGGWMDGCSIGVGGKTALCLAPPKN